MKRKMMTALCVAAVASWAMVAAAQSSTSSQSGQSSQSGMSHQHAMSGKTVKMTGCLQSGTSPNTYMLTNVSQSGESSGSDMSSQASGTSGSGSSSSSSSSQSGQSGSSMQGTSGSSSSGMGESVELVASKKVDLKAHVGHTVEITGVPAGMAKTSKKGGSSSASSEPSTQGTSGSMMPEHRIRVQSVKHISDSCQSGK